MYDITHNSAGGRFEVAVNGHTAELTYRLEEDRILFTHTGVPPAIEGKGVGSALVRAGVEHARENGLTIVPVCSFVAAWLDRHPEA